MIESRMKLASQFLPLGAVLFFTGLSLAEPPAAAPASAPKSASNADLLAEALPELQAHYVDFPSLGYKQGDRLDDLIARSHGRISLHSSLASAVPSEVPYFHSSTIQTAFIPGNIIYWRLPCFTPQNGWPSLAAELDKWLQQAPTGIILDLRSTVSADYNGAAHAASCLVPLGARLFLTQDSDGPHAYFSTSLVPNVAPKLFPKPIVVLVNHRTSAAAETLAASLKAQGALVVGQGTRGRGLIEDNFQFTSGQVLTYLRGHACFADGTEIEGHPLLPDIGLTVNEHNEDAALALIDQQRLADVIAGAAERQHLNEAALVRGDDPEADAALAAREKKPATAPASASIPAVQDIVLVSAIDSLKAIDLSQRHTPAAVR
jgi:hypothetical protein